MLERPEAEHESRLARSLVVVYRLGIVLVVLVAARFAVRWYLSRNAFYYLTPYPPPPPTWWDSVVAWLSV